MKINEIIYYQVSRSAIIEEWMSDDLVNIVKNDGVIFEMANLRSRITDLPSNIILWAKSQPEELPHSKYRIKITKDHKHVSTYSLSSNPKVIETYFKGKKYNLDSYEHSQITKFIKLFYPIIITYIDGKINEDELEIEIQKINRSKNDERI